MKRLLLSAAFFSISKVLFGQMYGNEWIHYDQKYVRFDTWEEGIYRIDYTALNEAVALTGESLTSIDPRNFQLFFRGLEQPIYIEGEDDGVFNSTDFIEFFGRKNDGTTDTKLYDDPDLQLQTFISLFTDTATFFLTWNSSTTNLRLLNLDNSLTSLPAAETYCKYESLHVFGAPYGSADFFPGKVIYNQLFESAFSMSEGFLSGSYPGTTLSYNLATPHIYTGASFVPTFSTALVTTNVTVHHTQIEVNGTLVVDTFINDALALKYSINLPEGTLLENNTVTYKALASSIDYQRVSYLRFTYPRLYDFDNFSKAKFFLSPTATSEKYLEVTNFDEKATQPLLYDLTDGKRITGIVESDISKFHLDYDAKNHLVFISSQDALDIKNITEFTPVQFIDFHDAANQGDYLILSHPALFDDGTGINWVEEYRGYRASTEGGSYVSKVIDVQQLYDQFYYGIKKHPLSIRNFALFAVDSFTIAPRYIFLIGKSYTYDLTRPSGSLLNEWGLNYVPTFGFPGSDNLLVSRPGSIQPEIPIGRLTTIDPDEVRLYYEKVVEYEQVQATAEHTVAGKSWMKNVLHFAGGLEAYEQSLFDSYLNDFTSIIEDTLYGAHVQQFNKTSTDPILYSTTDYIDSLINAGTSLLTFFGHAATSTFDYNIGQPEDFENAGRYFVVFSNGCNSAAIHGYEKSLTEEFVLQENKAAVAFIASSTFSIATSLYYYGKELYDEIADGSYNLGLGDAIMHANASYDGTYDIGIKLTAQHTTLQGDPALRLNTYPKPDYDIEAPFVTFDPPLLSTAVDSFTINIVVSNLGMAIDTSYFVEIIRHKPNGTNETYIGNFKAAYYRDTLRITFFTDAVGGVGLNAFDIHIDNTGFIDELDEMNNMLSVNAFIISNDAIPVYPYEYAIVNHVPEYLAASTADLFADEKQFVIQIDTTMLFNSPLLSETHVTESGGIVRWNAPPVTWIDSTVYYWRISLDTLYDNELVWRSRSFIYKPGIETGWNQSHYFQYLNDTYHNILLKPTRKFEFVTDYNTYYLHTGFDTEWYETYSDKNGEQVALASCVANGFLIFDIDYATGFETETYDIGGPGSSINTGPYGDTYCSSFDTRTYLQFYTDNTADRQDLYNFLQTVPDSNTLIFYSYGDPHFYDWADDEASGFNLMDIFEEFGAVEAMAAASIEEGRSYIMRTKKGNPATTTEVVGLPGEIIDAEFIVTDFWNAGDVETTVIGPASYWDKIKWNFSTTDSLPSDIVTLDVIGITPAGLEYDLYNNLTSKDTSITGIPAAEFPYIKLRLETVDDTLRTPTQIEYLRVIYTPVPEAALNPNIQYTLSADTLAHGDHIHMSIAVTNISELDMDSLLIDYNIVGQNNILYPVTYPRQDSLRSNETLISNIQVNTAEYPAGMNLLFIEVNPDNDQPEQYHFNNLGFIPIYVEPDVTNPLIDVTFDGVHILNGDIVSAQPAIDIELKDENMFLALSDTNYLDVKLKFPDGTLQHYVYDDVLLRFYPADSSSLAETNTARVEFRPGQLPDGTYTLFVHGQDVSGNKAGNSIDYSISFEVINKPMLSNVFNYPNPFTTQTRFVFTLTGSQVPEYFRIQIMTITGKVIREIQRNELGALHIGHNITEFAWNGTDAYGDPVANGLYLYRVVTRLNGKPLEKFDTSTDQFFNNGFGKMYLAR